MKRRALIFATAALAVILCACGKKPADGKGSLTPTAPAEAGSVTPAEGSGTPGVTIAPDTPTATPTSTPSPTPTGAYGSPSQLRANRELHNVVEPKVTPAPLGTAPALTDLDKADITYGIQRTNPINCYPVNLVSGARMDWNTSWYLKPKIRQSVRVTGLSDETVQDRIARRIDEVVWAMADPNYGPDDAGSVALFREMGAPEINIITDVYDVGNGFLPVYICANYMWIETVTFATTDDIYEFQPLVQKNPLLECWEGEKHPVSGSSQWEVEYTYYVSDDTTLLFNLATGDEVSLSDLFPEGMDYRTYLNNVIAGNIAYEYWYRDTDWGRRGTGGSSYDEYKEYDGASVFTGITDKTKFTYRGNEQTLSVEIPGASYDCGNCLLPEKVPNPCSGRNVFTRPQGYSFTPLEELYLSGDWYATAENRRTIGNVTVSSDSAARNVAVEMGGEGFPRLDIMGINGEWTDAIAKDIISDSKLLAFVKDWLNREWPALVKKGFAAGIGEDFVLANIALMKIETYPNGYACVTMTVSEKTNQEENAAGMYVTAWMKDGRFIPSEELFDVSLEELLEELLLGLRKNGTEEVLTQEEASTAAKALVKYINWANPPETDADNRWKWDLFDFRWGSETYSSWGTFPKELEEELPKALLNNIFQDAEVHVDYTTVDPYCYEKHMRMYEGYPFE